MQKNQKINKRDLINKFKQKPISKKYELIPKKTFKKSLDLTATDKLDIKNKIKRRKCDEKEHKLAIKLQRNIEEMEKLNNYEKQFSAENKKIVSKLCTKVVYQSYSIWNCKYFAFVYIWIKFVRKKKITFKRYLIFN